MEMENKSEKTRRDFINEIAGCLTALSLAGPVATACGFGAQDGSAHLLAAIKIQDHQELQKLGGFVVVKKTPAGDVLVVRSGEEEYSAMSVVCPHLQCNVKVTGPSMIQCPCHKSGYKTNGEYVSGPAKTGLKRFPLTVQDGVITVTEAHQTS